MFAGFKLEMDKPLANDFIQRGEVIYKDNKNQVEIELHKYIQDDNSLNGTMMQNNWFPQIKADVFISHSHKDENIALGLAGWLKEVFGLTSFIDSSVWGYAGDLLKEIDDKYCLEDSGNYNYQKRNYSTSHVHTMLSTALTMMMDKTECVIFINSENSTETKDIIEQTNSPWIYLEIAMSNLIRKSEPHRNRVFLKKAFEASTEELTIKYNLDLNHLSVITSIELLNWQYQFKSIIKTLELNPLDLLYKQYGLINNLEIIKESLLRR